MSNDVIYGADVEARIGAQADATSLPTTWGRFEFKSMTVTPQKERRDRPLLGVPNRHNRTDPVKPIPGFKRLSASIVMDADTNRTPTILRPFLGAPASSGPTSGLYTHVWNSGDITPRYVALMIKLATGKFRLFKGLSLNTLGITAAGENTRDFDLNAGFMGLEWDNALTDWTTADAPTALPTAAPAVRARFLLDGAAAAHTLSASWNWDRGISEDIFLSDTPTISGLRPENAAYTGSATFRAAGGPYDVIADGDTVVDARVRLLGPTTGHLIDLQHGQVMLPQPPITIDGPGIVQRTINWVGHQDDDSPGGKITVVNATAAYA